MSSSELDCPFGLLDETCGAAAYMQGSFAKAVGSAVEYRGLVDRWRGLSGAWDFSSAT